MNIVNRLIWIGKRTILISYLGITSCTAEPITTIPFENVELIEKEIIHVNPAAEQTGCEFQVGLAVTAYEMKENGIPERNLLQEVDTFKRPMPQWLYVRYQQIIRDVYRKDRNVDDYAGMVYHECRVYQLYINKVDTGG